MIVIPEDSTSTSMKGPQAAIVAQSKIMRTRELVTFSSNHRHLRRLYVVLSLPSCLSVDNAVALTYETSEEHQHTRVAFHVLTNFDGSIKRSTFTFNPWPSRSDVGSPPPSHPPAA